MNPNPPAESSVPPPSPSLWRRFLAALRHPATLIALLVLALAAASLVETRMVLDELRLDLARRLAASDNIARESHALARQNQGSLAAAQDKLQVLEGRLEQMQSQQLALESMYQEFSRSRDERLLAEIEQSLSIAAQQLQLAGNVETALIALQEADNRLSRVAQPQFFALRKLIAHDIERLRSLPGSDRADATLKLETVILSVDSLPLAFERRPKPAANAVKKAAATSPVFWKDLAADIWGELRQLIRIQRIDQPEAALLAPDQAFYLRENLKLRLINARLSILARDGAGFHEDVRQARVWLEKYFDTQSRPVQSALSALKGIQGQDIAEGLPTLDDTLSAVRNFRGPKGKN